MRAYSNDSVLASNTMADIIESVELIVAVRRPWLLAVDLLDASRILLR